MDAGRFRTLLRDYGERVAHVELLPARDSVKRTLDTPLHPDVQRVLREAGYGGFYSHQAEACDAAMRGQDVAVVTGTSSGKSLCYVLPTLQKLVAEPDARALFVFPTKALAQDQLGRLERLAHGVGLRVATYDGDTPKHRRAAARRAAHIIVTNPDMLHIGVLPGHEAWAKFLRALRVVVVDEMHAYRGVFGSHVAGVLRRLLRLAEWHRARPVVIGSSATIANPGDLFTRLTGRTAHVVADDGAPKSERAIALVDVPESVEEPFSPNAEAALLTAAMVEDGARVMTFCRARVTTELVALRTRARLKDDAFDEGLVESYRAGYTPEERRSIERALFTGRIRGLVTTSAMELGVDVGGLDAVILNGYPGSIASFWQQVGRAGRGTHPGVAVMLAHDDPLERFLVRAPEVLFGQPVEAATLSLGNRAVLEAQLRCAAYERALDPEELAGWAPNARDVAQGMVDGGELAGSRGLLFYPSHDAPAPKVSIRGFGGPTVRLYAGGELLGEMEYSRALARAHAGAVYLHRGQTYLVERLDLSRHEAWLTADSPGYHTEPIVQSVIESQHALERATMGEHALGLEAMTVTTAVTGFRRLRFDGGGALGEETLELPPESFDTIGVRLDFMGIGLVEAPEAIGAIHGVEHALRAVAPLLAGCDPGDLGSAWYVAHPGTFAPAVFVYDHAPGGVGLAERLFSARATWIAQAHALLATCRCDAGCPACLFSSRCEIRNDVLDKPGALLLLARLAERD